MSRRWKGAGSLMVLAGLAACDRSDPPPTNRSGTTGPTAPITASAAPSAVATAAVGASAAPAAIEPPRAPAAKVPCKAAKTGKQAALGTRTDGILALRAWGDRLILLGHKPRSARTTIAFFSRDGADKGEIGRYEGLGEPRSFRLTADHGYFIQKRALLRMPLAGGEAQVLSKGFGHVMTVHGAHAYGMRCADKGKNDELVQVAVAGGDAKVLATIERTTNTCQYGDIAVRGQTAFVTEWEGRRLLSVDLDSGKLTTLSKGHGFASTIFVRDDHLVISAANGLVRVPRSGGKPTTLTEVGSSPFGRVVEHEEDLWIFQAVPYGQHESIWRFAHGGDKAVKISTFVARDESGSGVHQLTVDDQCYYYAKIAKDGSFSTILAHARQAKQ